MFCAKQTDKYYECKDEYGQDLWLKEKLIIQWAETYLNKTEAR